MFDIDARAIAHQENNPPPPWWPFPPADAGRISDFFPLVGNGHGERGALTRDEVPAPRPEREPRYLHTDADILAQTFPGDKVSDVATRIGCSRSYIQQRRKLSDTDLAGKMDAKRGWAR